MCYATWCLMNVQFVELWDGQMWLGWINLVDANLTFLLVPGN